MTAPDNALSRLAKVLALMSSNHDGEALAAARKADELRLSLNCSWDDLLTGSAPDTGGGDMPDYSAMFQRIREFNPLSGRWAEILNSLDSFYRNRGYLTEKQQALLGKLDGTARKNMTEAA